MPEFKTCRDPGCEHHGRHAHAVTFRRKKRPQQWWDVYNAIYEKLHHRKSDGFGFSTQASQATDAAFDALSLPKHIDN